MDLVSIIIPAYNVAAYIDKCVASACDQTYENLEIILVDDGSTDECTPGKCDEWAKKDNRVKVIHKKNGGLSDARNAGLDAANGSFIYFLDGDDYISPDLVSRVVEAFDNETSIVFFSFLSVDEKGGIVNTPHPIYGTFDLESNEQKMDFILAKLLSHKVGWEAWNKMFRRELIERYHLRFADNNKIFAEDQYFSVCYCLHASAAKSIPDRLYYYVQRGDSIMGKCRDKNNIDRISLLSQEVFKHISEKQDCSWVIDRYPLMHYVIIRNELSIMEYRRGMNRRDIRDVILRTLNNQDFFFEQIKQLKKFRKDMFILFGGVEAERELNTIRYYMDGNYFASRVRNRIITWLTPFIMQRDPNEIALKNEYNQFCRSGDKRIYLIGTEDFGNLGDHQIAESILSFSETYLSDFNVKEVAATEYAKHKHVLEKVIRPCDVILMTGGGNFGDTYLPAEEKRRDIIATWRKNRKVVMPQTVYFSDTTVGNKLLAESREVYTAENNVTLFTRDEASYKYAESNFQCPVYECPDIVLSTNKEDKRERKKQIVLCFRHDIEKSFNADDEKKLTERLKMFNYAIRYADTQLEYHVKKTERKKKLAEIFELWKNSALVITDRLHGMAFAAITGTPCIALDNFNGKVHGTYSWIAYLPYVRFADNVDAAIKMVPDLLETLDRTYSNAPLNEYYHQLEKCIRGVAIEEKES